jgi:DNA-binding MarR family transcriptional regulator
MAAPTDIDLADAWSETLRRHARISCALERALQVEHGLGVSEFEVLEWLAVHGKDDCRMQELSEGVHLSQSALSRLVGRLEADGLVHRKLCQADRRGIYACITDEGRNRYEAARPTQRSVLAATWDG